jgi:hypothetical protein
VLPVVVGEVLRAEQARLGPPEVAPLPDQPGGVVLAHDLAEEVVGREEDQPAAEVAIALDEVVEPPRHVLGVAREDDQVVGSAEGLRAREQLDVLVGVRVDRVAA